MYPSMSGETTTTTTTDSAGNHGRPLPRAVIACIAALAVFAGSIALLYHTWLPRQNPSAMIVVLAAEPFVGAEVTIVPVEGQSGRVRGVIGPEDDYRLRLHVPPGLYNVTINFKGHTIAEFAQAETDTFRPCCIRLHPPGSPAGTRPVAS